MKHILKKRLPAILLAVVMLLSLLPLASMALEASSLIVAWEYNKTTTEAVEVPATFGSGTLSHSSGDAISGGDTGFFDHGKWSTSEYWLLSGINTAGKSNLTLSLRTKGTATGPKNWVVEYSTDAGGNSKINMVYMTGKLTGTHESDPAKPTYPADYAPEQEDVDTGFVNADIKGDMIVGWKFEDAATMPAEPTETGWGCRLMTLTASMSPKTTSPPRSSASRRMKKNAA